MWVAETATRRPTTPHRAMAGQSVLPYQPEWLQVTPMTRPFETVVFNFFEH